MRHSFLDRYRQGTSLIHRLDPRLKFLATLAYVLAVTTTPPHAWPALGLCAVLALAAIAAAEVPLVEALKRSTIALPFAGMVALSLPFTRAGQEVWGAEVLGWHVGITDEGLALFVAVVAKAWLSVTISGLLVATTPFPKLLRALHWLRVPAVLVSTISFMYRYLFVLVDEAQRLHTARESRSAGQGGTVLWRARVLGGMVGSLFIRSYERSERIYAAMLSRGFAGEIRVLSALQWQGQDSRAGLAWAGALAVVALLAHLL
ncbi:MAG TPA: cobalt ECF transporter T component CbiQ [Anaerolineae bacterium]|nr:cobalt ECF transporter T component CbiQ [Anaerolineae bacterium]